MLERQVEDEMNNKMIQIYGRTGDSIDYVSLDECFDQQYGNGKG